MLKPIDFNTKMDYSYVMQCVEDLKEHGAAVFSIGKSWQGNSLYNVKLGAGERKILYVGAHHALEWCTSQILLQFAIDLHSALKTGKRLCGCSPARIFSDIEINIIPMLNPDGVEMGINGMSKDNPYYERVFKYNGDGDDFENWQANARGVDLNHNYNYKWAQGKKFEHELGLFGGGPTRYSGEYPESEKETAALCGFARSIKPYALLALHSQGGEIYSNLGKKDSTKYRSAITILSKISGYANESVDGYSDCGGCKDWFASELGGIGLTIEAGHGKNPLTAEQSFKAYNELKELLTVSPALLK